jgi:hypothetical protein
VYSFGDYIVEQMLGMVFIAIQIVVAIVRGIFGAASRSDDWNVEEKVEEA